MIEISDIKWFILAIVAIFVVIGLIMLLWAIRLLQAQNTYRKLLNVSIDNEKRTNLGIQSEKELNKFLFELLKDLVSPGDEQTALYKIYNLRAILTIMEIDHDRMKAFHYIRDTLHYPDPNSSQITSEVRKVLGVCRGVEVLEPGTRSAYDRFNRAVRALEYLDRKVGSEMDDTIMSDKLLDKVIQTEHHVNTTTPIGEERTERTKDKVKIVYRSQTNK